ncbi:MAG TPA: class I SAM-dependent methyltransferase [Thermodesulfobacteriota bacterium]|nr:class I SAM-dependent methyltransferase [Thermodesulfobacteriota bacterium]
MSYSSLLSCANVLHPGGLPLTQRAFSRIGLPEKAKVLDIGCGAGFTLDYLNTSIGLQAVGMDLQPRIPSSPHQVPSPLPIIRALAEDLPVASCCLDAVVAECVLSLMTELCVVFCEICRVLKPAGKLILSDVYLLKDVEAQLTYYLRRDEYLKHFWTKSKWERELAKWGLQIIQWEDHTRALQVFAAQTILAGCPLDPALPLVAAGGNFCGEVHERLDRVSLGYFMGIAAKVKE